MEKLYFILMAFSMLLPWKMKRLVLVRIFKFKIHPTAKIGFSFVYPIRLDMGAHAYIRHLTVCKGLELLKMGDNSIIGNLNWISGSHADSAFFSGDKGRKSELILGSHAAVTNRHYIDCSNSVYIGHFSTFAGFRSQILTHAINLRESRQSSAPVIIGDYCFVGTNCVLLGGARLPNYCVLGASSLLNKSHTKEYCLYAGVPAICKKELDKDLGYFLRQKGFVD